MRTLIRGAALGLGLVLAATAAHAEKLKVGFVYLGPVGDFGWTYQHEVGRQLLQNTLGDAVETSYVENVPEGPDARARHRGPGHGRGNKLIFTTSVRLHGSRP